MYKVWFQKICKYHKITTYRKWEKIFYNTTLKFSNQASIHKAGSKLHFNLSEESVA